MIARSATTSSVAGFRAQVAGKGGISFAWLVLLTTMLLILPPLAMILFGGLTDTDPGEVPHFTTETLRLTYGNHYIYGSLLNSLIYAASTTVIAVTVGGFLAWLVERTDGAPRFMVPVISIVPVLLPSVIFTSAWIMLLNPTTGPVNVTLALFGIPTDWIDVYSYGGMIFIGALQEIPLAFLWLWPAFRSMNPALEEAGMIAGASLATVTRRITLPLLTPAILAATLICFIYALSALSVPLMVGVPAGIIVYATEIYLAVARVPSNLNAASALCMLFLLVTVGALYLYRRILGDTTRFAVVSGKAYSPRKIQLGPWRVLTLALCYLLFLIIGALPIFVIGWNAMMPFPQAPTFASIQLIQFGNFMAALNYGPAIRAVANSLLLGVAAGIIATALGFCIALLQYRTNFRRIASLADQLGTAPITFPGILVGVSLLWTFLTLPIPIYGTRWILLIAYVTLFLPFAVRSSNAAFAQIHRELDEAAYIAGASQYTTSTRILVPLLAPSLVVSALYIVLRTFREYSASIFLTAVGTEVFSVLVLDMWSGGNSNILAAYVIMVMGLLFALTSGLFWLSNRLSVRG